MVDTLNNLRDFAPQSPATGNVTAIAVSAAADNVIRLLKVPVGASRLLFDVTNAGSNAFDQFEVQRRSHEDAAWETLASVAGDYNPTPKLPILEVQGAPVTLAAAAVVNIRMEVDGTEGVRILASGDGATTATLNYRFGD